MQKTTVKNAIFLQYYQNTVRFIIYFNLLADKKKNKADNSAGFIYLFIILNRFIEDINLFINARCILWILFQQFHFFA